jgi:hypothetical protein
VYLVNLDPGSPGSDHLISLKGEILSNMNTIRGAKYRDGEQSSEEPPGLDLTDGDGILLGVEGRIKDHLHTWCNPQIR